MPPLFLRPRCNTYRTSRLYFSLPGARCSSVVRVFAHGARCRQIDPSVVDPLSYSSFQPVLHKGRDMCLPICGAMLVKEPLLLIGNWNPCGGSGFPLSLSLAL